MRGLWKRNGAFYAQLTVTTPAGTKAVRRIRLEKPAEAPVKTLPQAQAALARLKVERFNHGLKLTPKRPPTFAEAAKDYLTWHRSVGDLKRQAHGAASSLFSPLWRFAAMET